ncbi:hypothetical protein ANN_01979 [Periplaneta americana]|uniref:Uncharacterized protein n=1 Tax=Periplaneta americana TaxID=6978 RepID=A0ABQ8TUY6_PERAM|nr:hypothetical protein ANN_01979 [Periplaneta americana]
MVENQSLIAASLVVFTAVPKAKRTGPGKGWGRFAEGDSGHCGENAEPQDGCREGKCSGVLCLSTWSGDRGFDWQRLIGPRDKNVLQLPVIVREDKLLLQQVM